MQRSGIDTIKLHIWVTMSIALIFSQVSYRFLTADKFLSRGGGGKGGCLFYGGGEGWFCKRVNNFFLI